MKIFFCHFFLLTATFAFAQPLTLLKRIGQPPVNTQTGLSQIFTGDVLADGNAYFLGSHDGFTRHLWRTDGTSNGTIKIFEEGNPGSWKTVSFVEDGVFFNISDHLVYYKAGMLPIRNLGPFADVIFRQAEKMDTSKYIFLVNRNDTASLIISDLTAGGTYTLGDIGPHHNFMTMYAGPYGAVVYNTNSFVDYEPMMYDALADSILQVKEFLAPFKSVSSVEEVAMYDHYMFLDVNEGGTKRYVFDLRTHTFYPGQYFFGIIEHFYPYGDDLIIVSEREITRMDTTSFAFKEYTDQVFPLGTHLLDGDKMYYHGYSTNDTVYVFTLDLLTHKNTRLPRGEIGRNFYNSQFAVHEDELYYLRDFGPTTFLTRYDFTDSVAVDVDSITVRNGGLVIYNALKVVKGELLVSKFSPEEWHELYFLEEATGTFEGQLAKIKVYPNPCDDWLTLDLSESGNCNVRITDIFGRKVSQVVVNQDGIDTSDLQAGLYFGVVECNGEGNRFSFVKL